MNKSEIAEIRILTHPKRLKQASELQQRFPDSEIFVDENSYGSKYNHFSALTAKTKKETTHIIIMEDDSIPVNNFLQKAEKLIEKFPNDLLSFYLGTGRPVRWQRQVDYALISKPDFIELPALIHGVCYCIPVKKQKIFTEIPDIEHADFAVGEAWIKETSRQIIYPRLSLVDHADEEPIIKDAREAIKRKARYLNDK